jgi:hypothetical protein
MRFLVDRIEVWFDCPTVQRPYASPFFPICLRGTRRTSRHAL